jgi:hypothetical protein
MATPEKVLKVSAEFPLPSDPFAAAPILTKTGDAIKAAEATLSDAFGSPFSFVTVIANAKKPPVPRAKKDKAPPAQVTDTKVAA